MKLAASIFLLGITSIVSQVAIQRELINSFYGNEFFVGIILASWLFWTAVGSGVFGRFLARRKDLVPILVGIHLLSGLILFCIIFFLRFFKNYIGFPGELPNLVVGALTAFFIPAFICILLGAWWSSSSRASCATSGSVTNAVNRGYLIEIAGFIVGGIIFSFLLVRLDEFHIADLLVVLNFGFALCFVVGLQVRVIYKTGVAAIFLIFIFILFTGSLRILDNYTNAFRYKSQRFVQSINTQYGNITVTGLGSQYNFYENGVLIGTTEKVSSTEEFVHLSLLEHPNPKKVLLIGGGFYGLLGEVLKHPVSEVYYLELDPNLIGVAANYLTGGLKRALADTRVNIKYTDGYYFLKNSGEKFDAILINLPAPSTALINRYYTKQFFEMARSRLEKKGILSTDLPFSASSVNENLADLNASIFLTLKEVFANVIILPEDVNLILASDSRQLTYDAGVLIDRYKERGIKSDYINESYISYRLTTDRIPQTLDMLGRNTHVRTNTSLTPTSYFYQNLYWLDHFYPKLAVYFGYITKYFWYVATIVLGFVIAFIAIGRKNIRNMVPIFSVSVAGFSLMALEVVVIYIYQIEVGYLYYRLALLIAALMLGMALGVALANKIGTLLRGHILLVVFCVSLPLIFKFVSMVRSIPLIEGVLLFCAALAGFLGAVIFPISNKMYLLDQKNPQEKTGIVYSADLAGSCLGALLISVVVVPVFGVYQGLLLVAVCNVAAIAVLALLAKDLRCKCE